nr:reverse transcriptase domain-containing protein [Tanacetum cinerariifolium]
MRTRSSFNLPVVSPPNPSTSNPKRRNRRRSKQPFNLEESPIDTMADQRTMAELLRAPTEGYAEEIVVPPILAEQFDLKHSLINMMTSDQFFRLEKDNPHDHIRWFNKITFTIKYKDVPNSAIKLMLFPFSLAGTACRYKELLRACPHHGFTELHQLDTFYNALNLTDQDSLNSAAGGNLLERQIAKLTHAVNQQTSTVITVMTAILKQFQATPPSAFAKSVEEIYASLSNQTNEIKNMMASLFPSNTVANPKGKLKAITTRSGIVLDGPSVPTPPPFINMEVDERVEETLTDQDLSEYNIRKMLKALLSNKEKLQELANTPLNENFSAVILKKLPEKLGDPGKFLISCGFSELKRKALANLANRAICTPDGIARDVFVSVGKFTFPAYFIIVDYKSDPRVPLILGRPFLRTARALIDVHEGGNVLPEKLLDLDSTKDLHPPLYVNPLSGNTTYSSSPNQLLEEFADELALITFPLQYDDDLQFDIESDLKEIEYLRYHDPIKDIDSSLKDSIDQNNLANLNNNFVDSIPEMFTDKHALDYSSPPLFDEYDDDLFKVESYTENVYDDPFDSKGAKIKESKLLIDELDLPCDFLLPSEYDSFPIEDFSRVDALP